MATFLGIGTLPVPWLSCPSHRHDSWEIVLYLEGRGAITVGDEPVPFAPGVVVCLPPHIPHFERAESGYRNYHVLLDGFAPSARGVPRGRDDEHGTLKRLCELIHRESRRGDDGWRPVCQHLTAAFAAMLERATAQDSGTGLVDRLKAVLYERHRDAAFGVAEALATLPCAPDHARRVFRAATGRTPLAWLTTLRLTEAKHLLAEGSAVAEAAAQVGFADPYYFSRVFARAVGVSPARWARAQRRGGAPIRGGRKPAAGR